ncbi:DUF4974 domain-containing protein [uncultured Prevotella sp.]|uniref:DUF4974 domain-containing protein n=1 Tax=uncultured Prevotella sp. TaxID=159272 RepID=UPI0026706A0E|nr:DUF4974 domain-containing protein [uncultured Prevotella sp.]
MEQELYGIDSKKWDMLLDLLENPEKYSETQKAELLGDEEVKELYQQMVETRQALDFDKSNEEIKMPSVDEEWKKLKEEKLKSTKVAFLWSPMRKVAAVAAVLVVSGFAFAAIHLALLSRQTSDKNNTELIAASKDSVLEVSFTRKANIEEKADSTSIAKFPLVYENAELQNILTPIAEHFHLKVTYQNESTRHIRLFLQLKEDMSIDDIIKLMNHFEKVNIRHEGQTLIVE